MLQPALAAARRGVGTVISALGMIVLIVALLCLLLAELHQFRVKLQRAFRTQTSQRLRQVIETLMDRFQRYFVARTVVSAINGVCAGLLAWAVGLDFAFVWGLLAFVLNYVPTLGSILAVAPPVMQAVLQAEGIGLILLTAATQAALQIVLGNYIDPKIEGRMLSISPLAVLVSIVFWGWVWGIPGALLGVPLTVSLIIVCQHTERLRPLAVLLGDVEDDGPQPGGA
jgi:predicted PurR-regulated permease PerM